MRYLKAGLLIFFLALQLNVSYASVILYGTRIIYPAHKQEQTLTFANEDDRPYAVQVWVDKTTSSNIEDASAPFLVVPPVFQILPNTKQSVRLIYSGNGQELAQDCESLFYLSFNQIPASTKQELEQSKNSSQLMIVFRNTVKLFYRPSTIVGSSEFAGKPDKILHNATISRQHNNIHLKNNTGFYAVIVKAELEYNGQKHKLNIKDNNLAPFDALILELPNSKIGKSAQLTLTSLNDYGTQIVTNHELD